MAMAIPGGDFLTTGLNLISQSLLIPVVIILLIFVDIPPEQRFQLKMFLI